MTAREPSLLDVYLIGIRQLEPVLGGGDAKLIQHLQVSFPLRGVVRSALLEDFVDLLHRAENRSLLSKGGRDNALERADTASKHFGNSALEIICGK